MKRYSIEELKLADELCFPADAKRLLDKYEPEFSFILYGEFKRHGSLLNWLFNYSRHDLGVKLTGEGLTIGELFEAIISELIKA